MAETPPPKRVKKNLMDNLDRVVEQQAAAPTAEPAATMEATMESSPAAVVSPTDSKGPVGNLASLLKEWAE